MTILLQYFETSDFLCTFILFITQVQDRDTCTCMTIILIKCVGGMCDQLQCNWHNYINGKMYNVFIEFTELSDIWNLDL